MKDFMRNEGLICLKANSNGWLYDLLNATISPTPWDGVERRRTVRKQNDAEALEIPEGDYSAAREKTVKIRYRRLETSKPPNP